MAFEKFKSTTPPAKRVYPPITNGDYLLGVENIKEKKSKEGESEYLEVTFSILEKGPFFKRKLWVRFMTKHKNPEVVKIGASQIEAFEKAAGMSLGDMYPETKVIAFVCMGKENPPYPAQPEIKKFLGL